MNAKLPIASVTTILKSLLENELVRGAVSTTIGSDVVVSSLPPDRVSVEADERAQLNLFFYQATPNTRLRSLDRDEPQNGSSQSIPLELDLHYLITAYGAQELHIETLLGHTFQIFHERPLLSRDVIERTLVALALENGGADAPMHTAPAERFDEIAIRPQFLSMEEMARLWSALQARFRPSMTYKVTATTSDA